jgi:hypothetical protein
MLPGLLSAQATDPATRELIQKLMARIDSLEKRVAELEAGAPRKAAVPTPAQTMEAMHAPPAMSTPEAATPVYPSLKIAGFSDFNFAASDLHAPAIGFSQQTLLQQHSGFQEGQFVLHLTSALSQRVSFFGELSFTARADAGTGLPVAVGFNTEVERAIIRFDQSDYFKLSFGRYHTPINYWNTAFHHGQWLQTSISRPEMTQFGGSFIPVHFIGTLMEGSAPAGGLNLNYNFGLGNGRGAVISRGGDFGDINNNRAWLVTAFVKPDHPYGLQAGGSVYRDRIDAVTGFGGREWIESAHVVWTKETPEVLAEFANVHHGVFGGPVANSQAGYVQVAYRLPFAKKQLKPYYRFEYIHVPKADPIFRVVPTFHASTAGMRYDITTFAAFKFELRRYIRRDFPTINGVFSQVAFTF